MTPSVAAPPLIVVGASARGLAASARLAGWSVYAADLFADADLRAAATAAVRVPTSPDRPWPEGVADALRPFPLAPWVYVGALENHPDLVDRLARDRPLAGNAGPALRAARDPLVVAGLVRAAGLAFPDTCESPTGLPIDGSFLVKPRRGAGGRGISRWLGGPLPAGDRIWQRAVRGRAASVAFAISAAGARPWGASRQLIGRRWCHARDWAWSGAIDVKVDPLPGSLRRSLDRLGGLLADELGLIGLVGVDLVVDAAGVPHVIEINPRPTASLELIERATGASVAATHVAACGFAVPAPAHETPRPGGRLVWAKAVVFAAEKLLVCERLGRALADRAAEWSAADDGWPALADVPAVGTVAEAGSPLVTVFAAAHHGAAALRALRARVMAVRGILDAVSPPTGAAAQPRRRPRDRSA